MRSFTLILALLPVFAASGFSQTPIDGLWDGTVKVGELEIPFTFEFTGTNQAFSASFVNGDDRVTSTSASLSHGHLSAAFAHYAGQLEAQGKDGLIEGTYTRNKRVFPVRAVPHQPVPPVAGTPAIGGNWEIQTSNPRGEAAWRMVVRQNGAEVAAAVLRIDGDTGTLSGAYRNGQFVLGHFSGSRPSLVILTPAEGGKLAVTYNGRPMTATRAEIARAKGLPAPADPAHHTTVKDPAEPFYFRFPDLTGHIVADTDPRFRGKVILVSVGGSWCPNCHDEAPFLMELYRRYHGLGLEIVSLSFEEDDQGKDPRRLHAFVEKYGIEYPVLLCGDPADVEEKLPQTVNLTTWPATFFLGRDGRVRATHAGFASRATGELHKQLKEDMAGLVERLLAEAH